MLFLGLLFTADCFFKIEAYATKKKRDFNGIPFSSKPCLFLFLGRCASYFFIFMFGRTFFLVTWFAILAPCATNVLFCVWLCSLENIFSVSLFVPQLPQSGRQFPILGRWRSQWISAFYFQLSSAFLILDSFPLSALFSLTLVPADDLFIRRCHSRCEHCVVVCSPVITLHPSHTALAFFVFY